MREILYSFLSFGLFINTIHAQQQKISFENSEGYKLGTVVGQNGWTVKTDLSNSNFNVVTGKSTDGINSVEVTSNGKYTEVNNYLEKKIPYYDKVSISADIKLEALDGSDYYMTSLYANNKWAGGFNFSFDGAIYADSNVTIKYLGEWSPGKWYNAKIIVDHTKKTVDYYLDGVWVFVSPFNNDITKVDEVDFEFDNYQTGFVVDNIIVENLAQMSVNDINKNKISIYPNPVVDFVKINGVEPIKSVKIYNVNGTLIKTKNTLENPFQIDMSGFPKGVYYLSLETEERTEVKKIIKD